MLFLYHDICFSRKGRAWSHVSPGITWSSVWRAQWSLPWWSQEFSSVSNSTWTAPTNSSRYCLFWFTSSISLACILECFENVYKKRRVWKAVVSTNVDYFFLIILAIIISTLLRNDTLIQLYLLIHYYLHYLLFINSDGNYAKRNLFSSVDCWSTQKAVTFMRESEMTSIWTLC